MNETYAGWREHGKKLNAAWAADIAGEHAAAALILRSLVDDLRRYPGVQV